MDQYYLSILHIGDNCLHILFGRHGPTPFVGPPHWRVSASNALDAAPIFVVDPWICLSSIRGSISAGNALDAAPILVVVPLSVSASNALDAAPIFP
jgi:hypothetical protein